MRYVPIALTVEQNGKITVHYLYQINGLGYRVHRNALSSLMNGHQILSMNVCECVGVCVSAVCGDDRRILVSDIS